MGQMKKNMWVVLGLIAVVGAILAYVTADDSVLAQWVSPDETSADPVTLRADLVQDKVLLGSDGTVAVSLTLTAAPLPLLEHRPARHADMVIVLDRSGSMQGRKIDDAKRAVLGLVDRLTVNDRLSLVTYSTAAQTVFPLVFMDDIHRRQIKSAIAQIDSGGGTNLGGGLQQGIESLRQTPAAGRQRKVMLISDGLANHGITDPSVLGRMAGGALEHNLTVSTVGVGYDFNEILMTTIADHGGGSYYFLENPNAFARVFEKEFEATRRVAASALQLKVPLNDGVQLVNAGGYPIEVHNGYAHVQPGDLLSGQTRTLYLTYRVPTHSIGQFDLGRIGVSYTYNGAAVTQTSRELLALACIDDEKAVLSSIDQDAWSEHVIKEEYNQLKDAVASAIRRGEKEKAMKQIGEYELLKRRINQTVGSAKVSKNLDQDVQSLRQSVEETFSGAPAAVEHKKKQRSKALQYESYQIRRDKQ